MQEIEGIHIGPYQVISRLGAGAMGEVYRARDSRLGRDVAIKILPRDFATDEDRLARFAREAKVLASVNHPNIGAIYAVEEASIGPGQPVHALILELIEGETLADRMSRGPLTLREALRIADQVAAALDAAHEKGIIHRDLKPANIKITPDGIVKVLDFGLARMSMATDLEVTQATTLGVERTEPGMILGTAPYMSPEQARGQTVDRRTDIWSFGCLLFEMLSGRGAFHGTTLSDTIARILERDVDWSALPPTVSPSLRHVLSRTLAKDVKQRLRDIADVRMALDDAVARPSTAPVEPPSRRLALAGWVSAVALGVATLFLLTRNHAVSASLPHQPMTRLALPLDQGESYPRLVAISPDGGYVAYTIGLPGNHKTVLRSLSDKTSRIVAELPGDAGTPFFSPDSKWLGFFDAGKLKKIAVTGGSAAAVAEAPAPRGGTWTDDGSIVFAPAARAGLMVIRASSTTPEVLTTPDEGRGETSHRQPSWIPGTHSVVFMAEGDTRAQRALEVVALDTRQKRVLLQANATQPRYLATGHLAYLDQGNLTVAPFDAPTQRVLGAATTMLSGVESFDASSSGLLLYAPAANGSIIDPSSALVWVARDGATEALPLPTGRYNYPRVSPDGHRIVFTKLVGADRSLWIYDIARDASTRFTFDASNQWPIWTPDGTRVIYGSNRAGTQWDIYAKPANGSGAAVPILSRPLTQIPRAIAPDGDLVVYTETDPGRGDTLWTLSLREPAAPPRRLLDGLPGEMMPAFSPDGRWVAYVSPESGVNEVYVRSRNGVSGKWQVSSGGGVEPLWSPAGRELFYRSVDKMLAVSVEPGDVFQFGKPRALFEGSFVLGTTEGQEYDMSPDGTRFLMMKPAGAEGSGAPLEAVVNWFDSLRDPRSAQR